MRRMDKVAAAAALVAVGLAIVGASAGPAPGALQDGDRNFAGPESMCPGDGWDCTETFPVEQVGTENVIVCVGDTAACATSSQVGEFNKLQCIDERKDLPVLTQTCGLFTQTGGHNTALFKLTYDHDQGSTQCAQQTGEIVQVGETNKFKAQFTIVQETKEGATQTQEAHQVVIAEQDAEEQNESDVEEVQVQKASGDATTQRQNIGDLSGPCAATIPPDCSAATPGPTQPYACLNLEQELGGDGSENISNLEQDVSEEAETKAPDPVQQQGSFQGGNDGRVHQEAPDSGRNVDLAYQRTEQKLVAPEDDFQSQFEDPQCCGYGSQEGGQDNEESINQTVKQEAGDDADQFGSATGIGASLNGGCVVNQDVENNSDSAEVSETLEPCDPFLAVNTTCTSGGGEGGCFTNPTASPCLDGFLPEVNEGELQCVGPPLSTFVGPPEP